ncbi:MAG: SRPBCC family protein [Chloroflexota bacterium]|nr:SRPBCC family protein [Chloroflexota bacterium]
MPMPSVPINTDTARQLASGLGWFSLGLGTVQVAVPGKVNAVIGVHDTSRNRLLQRIFGAQELAMGIGIFSSPRRDLPVASRVVGDLVHVTLVSMALRSKRTDRARAISAIASLAGITALDAVTAASLRAAAPSGEHAQHITYATTVNRPVEDVYAFWRDFTNLPSFMRHLVSVEMTSGTQSRWKATAPAGQTVQWEAEIVEDRPNELIAWRSVDDADVANAGSVRFVPAPGDQGTEVHVTMNYTPPLHEIGTAVALLAGEDPRQQLQEDMLRLKNVLEVGEVVKSAGSVHGATLRQHAGQPPKGAAS